MTPGKTVSPAEDSHVLDLISYSIVIDLISTNSKNFPCDYAFPMQTN